MWTVAIPTARTVMTPHELREVAAGYVFLPSPYLAPVVGSQITMPSTEHNPVTIDLYGDALMNLPAPRDAHLRVHHDAIADAFRDHCVHDLGIAVRREVDDLFQHAMPLGNTVPRDELKDIVPGAELSLPAFNVVTGSYDPRSLKSTLLEFKTMRRVLYLRDILDMSEYTGMVFGTMGEVSKGVHRTYIVQYIRQPRRIACGGSVARGNTVQRQCTRRHPAKAEPARGCRPPAPTYAQATTRQRPARRGVAPAAAWTVADALSVAGVAAGAAWAPRIDAAARSLQPARVRHHPADVLAFTEVAAAWLAKARAVVAERHCRRGARRAGGAGQSPVLPSPALPSVAAFRGVAAPPVVAPTPPEVGAPAGHPGSQASRARYPPPPTRPSPAGDGVGWGAVDHLSDVDMVHMPAEMSMETAVPIDFQEAWAEAQRCVNERVVPAMEADDPVVLDRALKWKYLLPQLLLRAPSRGGRRRLQALAWRFRAFAERRMTELVRSWDDARTEAFYAGHARQRRTDADLFAALLVGTADTVVALVEDGAAGRLSSKGMGDLSDHAILAQLRDKHPSRIHAIPDAAYDIPVDEAALTVDMRVPYQQLKQHVAAGPSGMRNEYLRCLVGEYAPASGPAAVRAMSEVASMYLQGRLPGWFNRLFASARLVAPVKKLGEGRAPDVRPVAVGEAERRAAERAVVDNMKEAYVSVLAPSQLGVGIPAGDFVLIHGVRLIAEKLGPRAVIVHTDLRNAYNEAWRRTIIQRHIDCSPLHPVIPALLASLSTDSYLVVDDRSAPLRSEDGVQHGAPLATTSFCVAIHPEVQQCDTTLEVNDGAARFNADDGFLVGLPEHVWPALHAFRTSIKASVGLEVRFDKMQAYNADMEAARREAPADIEWPELDGHHGIAVLNVPLGSPEYVQAYMRGKAEELREEVDASLSKLLSAKPSRRYNHALHHHAWALIKHCMQHKAGYWLRNCLPSEVEAFAEAVDATILAAVERVLGVSFDPSTYGTDTNPVVTDFLAELLHDPDPMAAEVATLSEDAVARARSRLHLPTRLKGAGIRRMATVRDAAFVGCMNAILPRFLTRNSGTNTPTPGFFDPQLGSVLGPGSFNATPSARRYDHFLNYAHGSDSRARRGAASKRLLLAISATQMLA
eukprot:jgi/Tetstr1/428480/TSEL_018491.t1